MIQPSINEHWRMLVSQNLFSFRTSCIFNLLFWIFIFRFTETIWATTVETCQQLQNSSPNAAEQALWELHWRQIFGLEAFRYILQHIVQYVNSNPPQSSSTPKWCIFLYLQPCHYCFLLLILSYSDISLLLGFLWSVLSLLSHYFLCFIKCYCYNRFCSGFVHRFDGGVGKCWKLIFGNTWSESYCIFHNKWYILMWQGG